MPRFKTLLLGAAAVLAFSTVAQAQTPAETYQQQLDQYNAQQQQYQHARRNYEDRLDRYEYDRAHPAWWWRSAYFNAAPEWYVDFRGSDLIGTDVDEQDGRHLGRVIDFRRGPGGRIERVKILLHNDRATWVDADDIRYDRIDRIAFVDLPRDELYENSQETYDYRP